MSLSQRTRYTLLIPTYNRSALLRSLLDYLETRHFEYPIRVLDSSSEPALSENRTTISGSKLDIVHQIYNSTITPNAKFTLGVEAVESAYCSFCADDDVLLTDALPALLDFLESHSTFI